jgi:simple sugar transport system permease protein
VIAIAGLIVIYFILQGTYFGLKLKAVGKNMRSAYLLGIPTTRYMMMAFLICGAFAGLAGSIQVTGVYNRLNSSISSGYGYLGLLVAMLINLRALWAIPIALFFAALNIGSIQLPIVLKLDSSLSGVLQGALVLFVILMQGVQQRLVKKG